LFGFVRFLQTQLRAKSVLDEEIGVKWLKTIKIKKSLLHKNNAFKIICVVFLPKLKYYWTVPVSVLHFSCG